MTSRSTTTTTTAAWSLRGTASSGHAVLHGHNLDGTSISWWEQQWPFVSWAVFLVGTGWLLRDCWNSASISPSTRYPLKGRERIQQQQQDQQQQQHRDHLWYGWLLIVAYCLHQSEEHAYDLRGWRYSFVPSFNLGPLHGMFAVACGDTKATDPDSDSGPSRNFSFDPVTDTYVPGCPLDPKITLYVNIVTIFVGFGGCLVAATLNARFVYSIYLNWGAALVNGLMGHIVPMLLTQSYNPGVVQSLVMVPVAVWLLVTKATLYPPLPVLCLLNGLALHVFLILGVQSILNFQTNEALTMTVVMLLGSFVLPLVLSNYVYNNTNDTGRNRISTTNVRDRSTNSATTTVMPSSSSSSDHPTKAA